MNNDAHLIEKVLQGEQDAFDALVRRYQDAVYGLAFHLVGNFADAQDIAQQVFLTAYLRLHQLKDHERFTHWLNRITINECISWQRRKQSISRLYERIEVPYDTVLTPEQEYEQKELSIAVNKAMTALSEKNRLAVTMYYIDGLSQAEIGSFLGVPATVVANRISRAKKQLKEETMRLIEDTFNNNKLPDDFIKKIRETIEKGKSYMHKGNFGEALAYSDEALNALEDLQESSDTMRLRKEALWLKGQAVRFPLGAEETIKYSKQALELTEKLGDKRDYAEALVHLAYDYGGMGRHENADNLTRKALKICEEIGYVELQAEIVMSIANSKLLNEGTEKAIEYYQKALELCEKAEEMDYRSICKAAIFLINEVGKSPGIEKLIEFSMAEDAITKTPEGLVLLREPGFGRCQRRTDYIWEEGFRARLIDSIKDGQKILDHNIIVGHEQTIEHFSFTFKPLIAIRTVESNSETVTVIAGKFENCLQIKSVLKQSEGDNGSERTRNSTSVSVGQSRYGLRRVWVQ